MARKIRYCLELPPSVMQAWRSARQPTSWPVGQHELLERMLTDHFGRKAIVPSNRAYVGVDFDADARGEQTMFALQHGPILRVVPNPRPFRVPIQRLVLQAVGDTWDGASDIAGRLPLPHNSVLNALRYLHAYQLIERDGSRRREFCYRRTEAGRWALGVDAASITHQHQR